MRIPIIFFLLELAIALGAAEKKNISYYDANFPATGNLEYLQSRCKLDLQIPDGKRGFPTLVWFHGGGLSRGVKFYPPEINKKRIAIATVNYRLSGDNAQCPDYIYDAAAAIAWTLKHIEEFGGDPQMVYVGGVSAGGYLAAMVALAPKYLNMFGADPKQMAAVFPVSGQMTTHFQVLSERRKKDPNTPLIFLDEYAPIANASKGAPTLILIVGDTHLEWPGRVEENQLLEARLRRNFADENVRCLILPSFTHGSVRFPGYIIINNYILTALNSKEKVNMDKNN